MGSARRGLEASLWTHTLEEASLEADRLPLLYTLLFVFQTLCSPRNAFHRLLELRLSFSSIRRLISNSCSTNFPSTMGHRHLVEQRHLFEQRRPLVARLARCLRVRQSVHRRDDVCWPREEGQRHKRNPSTSSMSSSSTRSSLMCDMGAGSAAVGCRFVVSAPPSSTAAILSP